MTNKVRLGVCVLLGALFLVSCSDDGQSRVERGNQEQILHINNGSDPADLDPHTTTGSPESNVQFTLFEGLVTLSQEDLEVQPGVAESWDVSDDGRTYTFKLRENARWSNGDALTAEDYVWSWRRALLPELANEYAYHLFVLENAEAFHRGEISDFNQVGVRALDSHTLEVRLHSPTAYFLEMLDFHSMYAVHRPTIEKFGEPGERSTQWTRPGNLVGNGAFMLKEWAPNKVIVVEKNPHYWGADAVQLQEVHFYPVEQLTSEERMFRANQLHATYKLAPHKIASYREEQPEVLRSMPFFGTYFYLLNVEQPPLDDVRVRKALAYSIDREQITENVTLGGERPAYNLTPPDTNGYTAEARVPYDVERARELLAEAGYPNGEGFPNLTLVYNTEEMHQQIAVTIQQMWRKALNINITLENQDWKVFLANKRTQNFQIARMGWIGDYFDPNTFLDLFVTNGGNNDSGWGNERYDELIALAARTASEDERHRYFQEAEAILVEEVPMIPIYTYAWNRLVKPSVKNWHDNMIDRWSLKDVYLEPQSDPQGGE